VLDGAMAKRLTLIVQSSDRMIMIKVQYAPVDLVIIQLYMPTSTHTEVAFDEMY